MYKRMNIGTLGTSQITQQFIDATKHVEGCRVNACCSRDMAKAKELALSFDVQHYYDDYTKMCESGNVDTIYIACPNHLHFFYAKEALLNNLNVIIEKPFTSTLKEAELLIELAKSKKKFIFEAIPILYSKEYEEFKKYVHEIESIKIINANYSQKSRKYDDVLNGKLPSSFDIKQSGGALLDLNVYNIHTLVDLFGEPKECQYYANKLEEGVDTSGIAILTYDDKQAVCTAAKDSSSPNFFEIQGSNGYVSIIGGVNFGEKIEFSIRQTEINYTNKSERMINEIEYFHNLVKLNNLEECYCILEHTIKVVRVCEKLRKSANIQFDADKKEMENYKYIQ